MSLGFGLAPAGERFPKHILPQLTEDDRVEVPEWLFRPENGGLLEHRMRGAL